MKLLLGVLVSLSAIVIFYGYVYGCLKVSGAVSILKSARRREYLWIGIFFFFSSLFIAYMLRKNQFLYYWDYTMHWTPTISLSGDLYVDPVGTLKTVYNTTGVTDYNWMMPLLYALPAKIFGASFNRVVFAVYVFYMCPALVVVSLCIHKYLWIAGYKVNRLFLYTVMAFALPIVTCVLLNGFLDPPIIILSSSLLMLTSDFRYDHFDWKWSLLVAAGILMMVLFRRHWAYWTVGLIFSLGIECFSQIKKYEAKKTIKFFIQNMICIAVTCSLVLIIFFREFLRRSLRNYYDIYAGWNAGFLKKVLYFDEAYGNYVMIITVGIGFVVWKNRHAAVSALRMLFQMWAPILLMMSVVLMHDSHFYFGVVPILVMLAFVLEEVRKTCRYRKVVMALWYFYMAGNFVYCFYNPNHVSAYEDQKYHFVICDLRYQPHYREDVENITALVDFLNETTEAYNTDCYICASSHNINYHMLNLVKAPASQDSLQRDLAVASSDLRDGFSVNFFDAGIVVMEKDEYHEEDFEFYQVKGAVGVRKFLLEQMLDSTGPVGKHYKLIKEYELDYKYSSKAQVYLKTSEYAREDYQYLMEYYDGLYPDHKELFSERIKAYAEMKGKY